MKKKIPDKKPKQKIDPMAMRLKSQIKPTQEKIDSMKIGEKLKWSIQYGIQDAEFLKLSEEEMSKKIAAIPPEGVDTYGLAGEHKGKIECYLCHNKSFITKFWHHDDKSRYSTDYICENCKCSVAYSYDWSGPWD